MALDFGSLFSVGRAGMARIVTAVGMGGDGVTGPDPYANPAGSTPKGPIQKGKVFSRWTYPFRGYSMPILEIPSNRVQRYLLAFEYFTSDPLCNAATRIKTEFALGGMSFDVIIEEDEWPKWTPKEWKDEYNELIEDEKNKALVKAQQALQPGAGATGPAGPGAGGAGPSRVPNVKESDSDSMSGNFNANDGSSPNATAATGQPIQGLGHPNRQPSPSQDQPQITDVGKKTDKTQWQPGQDMNAKAPGAKPIPGQQDPNATPATEVTPIHQFVANKVKLELEALSQKLDIQAWIVKFAQDAMIYGDAFANIVDAFEGADGEDTIVQQLIEKNQYIENIRARYAQAYETNAPTVEYDLKDRIKTAVGVMFRGTSASLHVGPELLQKKREQSIENWHMTTGKAIYEEFAVAAKDIAGMVKGKNYTIAEMQSLNPSAVWVTRNDVGEVILIELVKRIGVDASPLNIDDIIHWKWQGPDWQTYGISEFYPAFRNIKLKRSLEEALAANAERYSNPIIQMKVGTDKVVKLQVPSQAMIDDAAGLVQDYDRRTILTTPYHYNIEIHGMDGKPLRIDFPLQYANNQIMAVLGIPETFLWGGGSNYASVRAQFQTMIFRLSQMQKDAARIITTRIFNRYLDRRGWRTVGGELPEIKVKFAQHELDSDQAIIGLVNAFANLAKSIGSTELPVSYTTILEKLGHNYEQEMYRKGREKALMRKMQEGQPGQAPAQTPQKTPPYAQTTRFQDMSAVAEDITNLSWTRPGQQRRQTNGRRRR